VKAYSEALQQQSLARRLALRDNGFSPFRPSEFDTIPSVFAAQVAQRPHKPAIRSDGVSTTYAELDRLSHGITAALRDRPSLEQAPIPLVISGNAYFAAAVLGVLRAGRSYIPLDVTFPESRNHQIIDQSDANVVLTERHQKEAASRLAGPHRILIAVDEIPPTTADLPNDGRPDALACVIFTSGSTGVPKGVRQTQRNILKVVERYTNGLCVGHGDRVSLLSSCSVTASVAPLLSALLSGATLCAFPVRERGLRRLANWVDAEEISLYHSVPSLFRHLMRSLVSSRVLTTLQVVRLGGDTAYKEDWKLFVQHCRDDAVLVNSYGCSEISSIARFYMDARSQIAGDVLPVGYSMPGVDLSLSSADRTQTVMEQEGGDVSRSEVGEIVISSRYLSPGYWSATLRSGADERTQETSGDVRQYRTGDLGFLDSHQGLVHVGRADSQVKILGHRVELAEIDAALHAFPGVKEAATLVVASSGGERQISSFVEMETPAVDSASCIREFAQGRLPRHMVPTVITVLTRMPCTPNGKIDRAELQKISDSLREANSSVEKGAL